MAKNSGSKGRGKQRREPTNRSAPASSAKASRRKRSGSAGTETVGSRLLSLFNSPAVRNVLAAGLVSAAGALIYNKRGGGDDSTGEDLPQQDAVSPTDNSAQATAPKRRRRVAARVSKAATQMVDAVEATKVGEALSTVKARARGRSAKASGTGKATKRGGGSRLRRPEAISPPPGIEVPVAGLGETETSAFAFSGTGEPETIPPAPEKTPSENS